jgi:predicted acetyltransferase
VRTRGINDGVWVNVRDVPTCFGARTYATDDRLVVEVDGVRHAVGDGAVTRVRTRPDLVTRPDALGALLLGGVSPTRLAAGRRLQARSDDVLRRAEHLFTSPVAPLSQTLY